MERKRLFTRSALGILLFAAGVSVHASEPHAATQTAGPILADRATMNGTAAPNGLASTAWFEWGSRGDYTQSTSPLDVGATNDIVRISSVIGELTNRGIYQFRLVVSNAAGVAYGAPKLFTTGWKISSWGHNLYGQLNVPSGLTNAVAVADGWYHSVALKNDGTLTTWGGNSYGEANVPAGLSNVIGIAAGKGHTVALKSDGTVLAWGNNSVGQTNVQPGLSNVVAVAAGVEYSLALKSDGTVWKWPGGNVGMNKIVEIAAGGFHSLALRIDGTVAAWGDNYFGQTRVPPGLTAVAVAAGFHSSVALKMDGRPVAWGSNSFGETNVPVDLTNAIAISGSSGCGTTFALKSDGRITGWGEPTLGQLNIPADLTNVVAVSDGLAIGNRPPAATPQEVSGYVNQEVIITLAGTDPNKDALGFRITVLPVRGFLYQCSGGTRGEAISANGARVTDPQGRVVFVPGLGESGNPYSSFDFISDDGDVESGKATVSLIVKDTQGFTLAPIEVRPTLATLHGMALPNGYHSRAWFEWGSRGSYGQQTAPVEVGNGGATVYVRAAITNLLAGGVYQCRLVVSNELGTVFGPTQVFTTGKKVTAWGDSSMYGRCVVPAGLSNVVAIAAGSHTLALKADGTVTGWGYRPYERQAPAGLSNVVAVAVAGNYDLALKNDGTLTAWGEYPPTPLSAISNIVAISCAEYICHGLTSNGTVRMISGPSDARPPTGLSNVVALAVGGGHCLALKPDGAITGWGANNYGQATAPPGLSNAIAIAAADGFNLAVRPGGTVVAWGVSSYGTTNIPAGLSNVIAVSAARTHCMAVKADGTVVAWGNGLFGETNVPGELTGAVMAVPGGNFSVALGDNSPPVAQASTNSGFVNHDLLVQCRGSDTNGDALVFRVASLPTLGKLYQVVSGNRGDEIYGPQTPVTDPLGRLLFAPPPNALGNPLTSFSFVADDGEVDSPPGLQMISILLPPAPGIASALRNTNGSFQLDLTGASNATYNIWASTNLLEWQYLGPTEEGPPGLYRFLDTTVADWDRKFYRAQVP